MGEKKPTHNDSPFVTFYDMCDVTFVLPDETGNVITRLQWFILFKSQLYFCWKIFLISSSPNFSLVECNTILSAYTKYRHLG